jgi:hypothetical protein
MGRGKRVWNDTDKNVVAALTHMGVRSGECWTDPELKSVAQIEKILPKQEATNFKTLWTSKSSGHVLAKATVGHDAAMFVRAGIPSAVILVRNANGSHNSDEALDREDFAGGVHVLGRAMHRLANAR